MPTPTVIQLPALRGIGIIAPSGCAVDNVAVERGLQVMRERGFAVHSYYQDENKYQRFGATDDARLQQLYAAIDNPEIEIVMALRGGYGLSRLLSKIDFQRLADSKKYLVGHSDFNALQLAMLAKTGASSVCGPMICDDFSRLDPSEFTLTHFFDCLSHNTQTVRFQAENNPAVKVSGLLWGGNLAMLTHLLGSDYFPSISDGILFVEDIGEHPYRVERMMLQLHHAGVLNRQKAVVFGDFSAYKLASHDNGYDFEEMVRYLRSQLSVPLLTGLPFGHIKDKVSLVIGSTADLHAEADSVTIKMRY
jgi:muramoyltetrapeptide carboxypeptidase